MVKNSIGFSAKRGDQFSLTSFDFVVPAKIDIPQLSWWQSMTFSPYLRLLISGILGLLLIIFAVIPLVRQLIASSATQQRLEQDTNAVDVSTEQPLTVFEDDNLPSTNQPFETKKRHLESLAKADPAKVAEVIGELINKKGK